MHTNIEAATLISLAHMQLTIGFSFDNRIVNSPVIQCYNIVLLISLPMILNDCHIWFQHFTKLGQLRMLQ